MLMDKTMYLACVDQIDRLFCRSFGRSISTNYLLWRYIDNPTQELLANVIFDGEDLIANYSASPCALVVGGKELKTALSMTTMTDPEHMGKGYFGKLARELYEHMDKEGYSIVWGFPNNNSHRPFCSKLQWSTIYEIPTMRLEMLQTSKMSVEIKDDIGIQVHQDDSFLLDYSYISARTPAAVFVKKTASYLQWRYTKHPANYYRNIVVVEDGQVKAYAIYKQYGGDEVDLVDFQSDCEENGRIILTNLIRTSLSRGVKAVNCWAPRHHYLHSLCESFNFVNVQPVTYFGYLKMKSFECEVDLSNYSNWYLQMGDSDVY